MNISMRNGNISINGNVYKGNSVQISNGKVVVDGIEQSQVLEHKITVNVVGDVESIEAGSGDVFVSGGVGSLRTGSGDVKCGSVSGNVQTGSGDIDCGNIAGSVRTGSGDISHRA